MYYEYTRISYKYTRIYSVLSIEIAQYLLKYKASAKEKNLLGWTPLNEAISYGNRSLSKCVIVLQRIDLYFVYFKY